MNYEDGEYECDYCGRLFRSEFRCMEHEASCTGHGGSAWANDDAKAKADAERAEAAENRNKSGDAFSPQKACDWVVAVPLNGRKIGEAEKNALFALKKALGKERKESLIYWGKVQECLTTLGAAYTGKAGKREAFNKFCEFMG